MIAKTIFRIGAADDADIIIKQPTVSKYHCELQWTEQGWILRDLDSTNGTFVEGRRLIEPCSVTNSQKITLGRDVLLELPNPPKSLPITNPISDNIDVPPASRKRSQNVTTTSLIAGCVVAGLLAVIFLTRSFYTVDETAKSSVDTRLANTGAAQNDIGKASAAGSSSPTSPIETPNAVSSGLDDSPYWAIVVESADGKRQQLVGTAVAIEPNRLLTLASIVEAVSEAKAIYPKITLRQFQQPGVRIQPTQVLVHPKYKEALSQLTEFETKLNDRLKTIETLTEPTLEESLDWSGRLESAMSKISKSDLACFVTNERFKKTLSLRESIEITEMIDCKIRGYPMIIPSPFVTDNLMKFYLEGSASLRMDEKSKEPILFAETSDFLGVPLVSMVCLDSQSRIIGLCVRHEYQENVGNPQRAQFTKVEIFWK